jgi:hypothetical protein
MIDPACGSGHFLLGAFYHVLKHWRRLEPSTGERELVNRALATVHGVDLNPYAIAIARFRLLIAAMRECEVTALSDAPTFTFSLACGDSLLHGPRAAPSELGTAGNQLLMPFHSLAHHYAAEDLKLLNQLLTPGTYHVVVANPPYISVEDPALRKAYRDRLWACHGKYNLTVPFTQRLFQLAVAHKSNDLSDAGFVGQITSDSFMRRNFGKKLVEEYLTTVDVTHVVDSSKAVIPGHGTPTIIMFGRARPPVGITVRALMGRSGEQGVPTDPANGRVWQAILAQFHSAGSESDYITCIDLPRESLATHPWSLAGGGLYSLKQALELDRQRLTDYVDSIGILSVTGDDDLYLVPDERCFRRRNVERFRPLVGGDNVQDWFLTGIDYAIWPYDDNYKLITLAGLPNTFKWMWPARSFIARRKRFGTPMLDLGMTWYEWQELYVRKLNRPMSITFAEIGTHNRFLLDRGEYLYSRSANIIKLSLDASEEQHLWILGLLNSSVANFWGRQVWQPKGGDQVTAIGARVSRIPWEDRLQRDSTKLHAFPVPEGHELLVPIARELDRLYLERRKAAPTDLTLVLADPVTARNRWLLLWHKAVAAQEELDWMCYYSFGLTVQPMTYSGDLPDVRPGERAFEIALARQMAAGELESTWFLKHGIISTTEVPTRWPAAYRELVERRLAMITESSRLALMEQPLYKRRWNNDPWEKQVAREVLHWLQDRLERYFDLDGRLNDLKEVTARGELCEPRLTTVAKVADLARGDSHFMQVAELFTERKDFDVGTLVSELLVAESVPALPVLRYKHTAMDKRRAWERTWELQRLEDAVDALFDLHLLKTIDAGRAEAELAPLVSALPINEQTKLQILREAIGAAGYVAETIKQKLKLESDTIRKPLDDTTRQARKAAVGDIPAPPKYTSADFQSSDYWRLRGKLDVPKERWVSFPHCEGEDGTLVIAWAGYDHLQLARAIAERYELAKEQEGRKLVPLLAAIGQLIPWLKQWHNEFDSAYGTRMGDYFEAYLVEEAKALGMSVDAVMAWTPPEKPKGRGRRKSSSATTAPAGDAT